jgi:hypothetical protein
MREVMATTATQVWNDASARMNQPSETTTQATHDHDGNDLEPFSRAKVWCFYCAVLAPCNVVAKLKHGPFVE